MPGLFRRAAVAGLPLLAGCSTLSSGFLRNPGGPIAGAERHEAVIVGIVLIFVWVPVFLLVPAFFWYYRIGNARAVYRPQWGFSWLLEVLIWVPPTALVVLLSVYLAYYTVLLDPYRPLARKGAPTLEVQVVALDWKWLFLYPAQHLATVNQVFVPAGQPVHFDLTSGTVMQSLLMPRLAGQIYAMDGMRTQLNFLVAAPGDYEGENTQYNGQGFAVDKFMLHALAPAAFAAWVRQAQAGGNALDDQGYQALSRQTVLARPLLFNGVAPNLFGRILAGQIAPGYLAQPHENDAHG